ncbi:MAG: adenylyltransferase/cytidyltransferase family protein [Cyanobacteria bacterium]|nr:adenylyltransferase/cytidyltransferase family protein [Cyanobacteriota bacterium]
MLKLSGLSSPYWNPRNEVPSFSNIQPNRIQPNRFKMNSFGTKDSGNTKGSIKPSIQVKNPHFEGPTSYPQPLSTVILRLLPPKVNAQNLQFEGKLAKRPLTDFEKKRVVYGGTFNPFHLGHANSVEAIKDQYKPEKITVIPAADPPHKGQKDLASFPDRYEPIQEYYKNDPQVEVSTVEETLPKPNYTLNTLEKLFPGFATLNDTLHERVVMVIGADTLLSLHKWHQAKTIIKNTLFLVANRLQPGQSSPDAIPINVAETAPGIMPERSEYQGLDPDIMWMPLDVPWSDLSSTELRELPKKGLSEEALRAALKDKAPGPVIERMIRKKLYQDS